MPDWIVVLLVMLGVALGCCGTMLVIGLWWTRRRIELLKEAMVTFATIAARENKTTRNGLDGVANTVARQRNQMTELRNLVRELRNQPTEEAADEQEPAYQQVPEDMSEGQLKEVEPEPERPTVWTRVRDDITHI